MAIFALEGQEIQIQGQVTDINGHGIEAATISIPYSPYGTTTDKNGFYILSTPRKDTLQILYSYTGLQDTIYNVVIHDKETIELYPKLKEEIQEIDQVLIQSNLNKGTNLTRLDLVSQSAMANSSGSFETLLKSLPGVASGNELSSQYSVRGGNFDENLVYINGIEIFKPFLIRSGQQEGLSAINPDLIESVDFSAGGFESRYGDKMSSVLDIRYKRKIKNKSSVNLSLLGGAAHIERKSKSGKLSFMAGARYKSAAYLLNSLEVTGDYQPSFGDFQTVLHFKPSEKIEFEALGNITYNRFLLIPTTRESEIGTVELPLVVKFFYEGQEVDQYLSSLGSLSMKLKPNNSTSLTFTGSLFATDESETFDILGQYLVNQLDNDLGSDNFGDSLLNIGVGSSLEHGRNYLTANIFQFSHKGVKKLDLHKIQWGFDYRADEIDFETTEWEWIDSTGYSTPYSDAQVNLNYVLKSEIKTQSQRISAYLQNTQQILSDLGILYFTYGLRANYWDFNRQLVLSPRTTLAFVPGANRNITYRVSWGYYYQPVLFREMVKRDGTLNENVVAQKSEHFIGGVDFYVEMWNRPFKITSDIYYKNMSRIIPYKLDNQRIIYDGRNRSRAYTAGVEFKINGEFVPNLQSWASLSFMNTKENIVDDFYLANGNLVYPGYFRRPTDQHVNFSVYFQDFLPKWPEYKFYLSLHYGSRVPLSDPKSERYDQFIRIKPYQRIDIGVSKSILRHLPQNWSFIKEGWVNLEVLNLFGFENVSSLDWVQTISNQTGASNAFGVPNKLTGRRLNVKLSIAF